MKLLFDTHALLWTLIRPSKIPRHVFKAMERPSNLIFASAVSALEISIKQTLQKLDAPKDLEKACLESNFELLPISFEHASLSGSLPPHHYDPFDRLLVAQAMIENMTIVTADTMIPKYDVKVLWD